MEYEQNNYLTPEEIKEALLELLLKFDDFCTAHGLRYSLVGGTLLGAIRHKGFIPWDDDIDIAMPRPDVDKLITLWKDDSLPQETSLEIESGDPSFPVYAKFVDVGVSLKQPFVDGVKKLWIDILPIDGMPADETEAKIHLNRAARYRWWFLLSGADASEGRSPLKRVLKGVIVPVMRSFGARERIGRAFDRFARGIPYGTTGYIGCTTWGLYGLGERYPEDSFDNALLVEFEGREFPALCCWDEYLRGIYGDYMQLPPEEKRITHGIKAWRVDVR